MILQIRLSDELYQHYAKRHPGDPRKAIEDALEAHQDLEPGVPRVVLENPELRELSRVVGEPINSSAQLLAWVKRNTQFSVAGIDLELSLGQRQRLKQMADYMKQPLDGYVKQQIGTILTRELGG
jgi:hypothetical protein